MLVPSTEYKYWSTLFRDYRDHRYDRVYRVRLGCVLPFILPFVILYVVLAGALAILTGCCCGCFRGGRCLVFRNTTNPENNNNNSNGDNRVAPEVTMTHLDGEERMTRGSARLGILVTIFIVFFPVILLSEDFGLHWGMLDDIFPETENEMPVMEVNSATTSQTTERKDTKAGKETAENIDLSDTVDSNNVSRMEEGL